MKNTLILASFLAIAPFVKGQLLLEALEGGFTPSEKCLERVYDKHYGDGVHNYIYCAVQGPNGKKWLNLNLGAEYAKESSPHFNPEAVPTDSNDWKAFGNLYQWGRGSDGHEQVEYRKGSEYWEFRPINGVRYNLLTNGEHSNQMVINTQYDIYAHNLSDIWINDPCPNGYHIATFADITALGSLNLLLGGHLSSSILGFTNYPQLRLVTAPAFYRGELKNQPYPDGYYISTALVGNQPSGSSSLWLKGTESGKYYKNGTWIDNKQANPQTEHVMLDRGFLVRGEMEEMEDLAVYALPRVQNRQRVETINYVHSLAIRCVQN